LYAAALVLLLGACAAPAPAPAPVPASVTPAPVAAAKPPAVSAAAPATVIESQPLKHLLGRTLKPIPDKALDMHTKCSFRDVGGGRGTMDLQVHKADVKRFVAEVNIPEQGLCRFELKNFEQTGRLPIVVLSDLRSACVVRMWAQENGVTVAFNSCQANCAGDAFSYLWPILVDTRTGRCS
jgi:hypothetical protein